MHKFLAIIACFCVVSFATSDEPRLSRANFSLTNSPAVVKSSASVDRYAESIDICMREGKIMVVFVNTLPQRFKDVVSYRTDHFADAENKAIIVGVPVGKDFYRMDFGPYASEAEIMSAVASLRERMTPRVYTPQQIYSPQQYADPFSAANCRT